ncbi:MAG TPA: winged helix-turn-helix domain-containing protein [Candidatus Omnitrophota bacterium]|nr:winged helix-turn-helix domain-containing protein [Candidatus Omnitrophota bacterium]
MKHKHISTLSRKEREKARLKAGKLFQKGITQAEVARRLNVTPAAVHYWHTAWKNRGVKGLQSRGHPGFASKLTDKKRLLFKQTILEGPLKHGYQTNLWTIPRLSAVLRKETGFQCSEVWIWHIVRSLGFTPKKPQVQARERDEKNIQEWKAKTLPGLKKMGSQTWVLSGV